MLNEERLDKRSNAVVARTLIDQPGIFPMSLGCAACSSRRVCGGLSVEANLPDCLALCCGLPDSCTRVCKNNPDRFVDQMREIGGFELHNTPRSQRLSVNKFDEVVPLLQHGSRRVSPLEVTSVAIPLPHLINYRTAQPRFETREQLCDAFKISTKARIVLTGVNFDERIEAYWALSSDRLRMIDYFKKMGIELVTAPNFSLVLDHPRFDDMHAMKRISLLFSEFQNAGLSCALHPNGRTDRDFERWGDFISEREEVKTLAYEFTTGPARKDRINFHLEKLAYLAERSNRNLDIVVRGKASVITPLRRHFRNVTYIESAGFMKSMKRQRAVRVANKGLEWISAPTAIDVPLDELTAHNIRERRLALKAEYFSDSEAAIEAA